MPLLSISVDQTLWAAQQDRLMAALPAIREMLCDKLAVGQAASHLTVTPVFGLPDQAQVTADLRVLAKAERGRELLTDVARTLQAQLSAACGHPASVRITAMDPATYLALK